MAGHGGCDHIAACVVCGDDRGLSAHLAVAIYWGLLVIGRYVGISLLSLLPISGVVSVNLVSVVVSFNIVVILASNNI